VGDDDDAESTSDTELPTSSAGNASAATPLAAHAAQKPALSALTAPLTGANPGASAALAQAGSSQDEEDGAAAPVDGSASRASTPLPLTMVIANSGGSAPDSQNTDGGTQGGDDSNAAATAAAAAINATSSAGSTHSQTQSVELQPVHTPVGSEGWGNEVGARLTLMAQQGMSSASLRLSPAHLGPLEIHISVRDGSATVMFGATQTETRTALEQALPRLREMFASQGLNLSHAGVSGETPRGASQNSQPQGSTRSSELAREVTVTPVTSGAPVHRGLIDTYA
jgi:flagellar hook-length control protein FliK